MGARQLDITQRQVRALCAGAKKTGYVPVLKIGNATVVLIPEKAAVEMALGRERDGEALPYDVWKSGQEEPTEQPAKETWNPKEFAAQVEEMRKRGPIMFAEGAIWNVPEYRAHVLAQPFWKREKDALLAYRDGQKWSMGVGTGTRLEARGYLTEERDGDRILAYRITDAGREARQNLVAERDRPAK